MTLEFDELNANRWTEFIQEPIAQLGLSCPPPSFANQAPSTAVQTHFCASPSLATMAQALATAPPRHTVSGFHSVADHRLLAVWIPDAGGGGGGRIVVNIGDPTFATHAGVRAVLTHALAGTLEASFYFEDPAEGGEPARRQPVQRPPVQRQPPAAPGVRRSFDRSLYPHYASSQRSLAGATEPLPAGRNGHLPVARPVARPVGLEPLQAEVIVVAEPIPTATPHRLRGRGLLGWIIRRSSRRLGHASRRR